MAIERRYSEIRFEGNNLSGIAIRYGEVAQIGGLGSERFRAGCFGDLTQADCILNLQHSRESPIARTGGGGLELIDTSKTLEIRASLNPEIAGKAIALVQSKILRGLSVEFVSLRESIENSVRVIERARLHGIGLVDKPAYSGSIVSVRASGFRSKVPYGRSVSCECVSGDCTHAVLSGESFIDLDEVIAGNSDKDVTAFVGDYKNTVGSVKDGSLRLSQDDTGLIVDIPRMPATQAVTDLIETSSVVGILARPYFKETAQSKSESTVEVDSEGNKVLNVKGANLRGILIGASDKSSGWEAGEFIPVQQDRRRRLWL